MVVAIDFTIIRGIRYSINTFFCDYFLSSNSFIINTTRNPKEILKQYCSLPANNLRKKCYSYSSEAYE